MPLNVKINGTNAQSFNVPVLEISIRTNRGEAAKLRIDDPIAGDVDVVVTTHDGRNALVTNRDYA